MVPNKAGDRGHGEPVTRTRLGSLIRYITNCNPLIYMMEIFRHGELMFNSIVAADYG